MLLEDYRECSGEEEEQRKGECSGGEEEQKKGAEKDQKKIFNWDESQLKLKIKDSGYAWVILATMFLTNIIIGGYMKSFGLISTGILQTYRQTSNTLAGLMMGLLSGSKTLLAPFVGALGNIIGIRRMMYAGSLIFCIALGSSFFCTSVLQLAFTLGAMVGMSHCMLETGQVVVISNYFDSKLSLANGIRVAGNPLAGLMAPMLIAFLLVNYGLKILFLLLTAVTTHLFIFTILMRPIDIHIKIKALSYIRSVFKKEAAEYQPMIQFDTDTGRKYNSDHLVNEKTFKIKKKYLFEEILSQNPTNTLQRKKKPLNVAFLKNPVYLVFIFMAVGVPFSIPLSIYYLTIYATTVVGLSTYEVSVLLMFQALLDFVLRISLGWLNDKDIYKKCHGLIFCFCVSGIGIMLIPFVSAFWALAAIIPALSFAPASFHSFVNVILLREFGEDSISSTYGFVRMTQGIFAFIHPSLIGYLIDVTGGYTIPFLVMGVGNIYTGAIVLLQPLVIKLSKSEVVIA